MIYLKYRKLHEFYLFKTVNKIHIWKVQRILNGMHILFAQFGFELQKLFEFENQGLFCEDFKRLNFPRDLIGKLVQIWIWNSRSTARTGHRATDQWGQCHGGAGVAVGVS